MRSCVFPAQGIMRPHDKIKRGAKRPTNTDTSNRSHAIKRKSTNPEPTTSTKKVKIEEQDHPAQKEEQTLLIRNLPFAKSQIDEVASELQEKFSCKGLFIPRKPNGNCKGYAFVNFNDATSALEVKEQYNGAEICGRKVFIEFADKDSLESQVGADRKRKVPRVGVSATTTTEVAATTSDAEVKAESVPEEEEKEEVHDGNDDGGFDGGVISREVSIKEEPSGTDVVRSVKQQPDEKIKVKKEIKREGIDEKAGPREEKKRKQLEIRRTKHIRLQMNRELDVCVKKRDVKFAEKLFEQFATKGVPADAYTYTHMINICARYGNVERARFYFDDMHAKGVKANVVTYTSFIKGLVMWGRMEDAVEVLQIMKERKVAPNFRTYNTLLRGCLKDGNVDLAMELFNSAKQHRSSETLDTSCYTYVIMCNCYALRTKEAWSIASELKFKTATPAVAKAYASLAVAEAVSGQLALAKGALQKAEACLEQITVGSAAKSEDPTDETSGVEHPVVVKIEEGEEVDEECQTDGGGQSNSETEVPSIAKNKKGRIPDNVEGLYSPIETNHSTNGRQNKESHRGGRTIEGSSYELFTLAQKEEIVAMCTAVKEFLDKETVPPFRSIKSMEESNKMMILPPKNEVFPVKLRYGSIFNKMTTDSSRPRDIKMEICSGLGDWVVYQAKHSPNVNWIAAEIRHERVFQIWSKGVLAELDNLFAVEADARVLINKYIPPDSLREVFINFPEPPSNENKHMHLLTPDFLQQINGTLQRHGKLIVVTDNFHLAHKLEEDLKSLSKIFKSTSGAHPFATQLPVNYGSSYFDKFWTQGQRYNRYYFEYKKIW